MLPTSCATPLVVNHMYTVKWKRSVEDNCFKLPLTSEGHAAATKSEAVAANPAAWGIDLTI